MTAGITADQIFQLNRMNSTANKVRLGTLIQNAETPAGNINIPTGKTLIGDGSGVGQAVVLAANATLANGKFLVGDGSSVAQAVNMSGDATMSNAGALTLAFPQWTSATGTLTAANIAAMNGAPVNLLPAPAAGHVLIIHSVEILHTYAVAAYANGGDVTLNYHGTTAIVDFDVSLVTEAASANWWSVPTLYNIDNSTGTAKGGFVLTDKAALGVDITNAAGAFTGGNAGNILKWRIRYSDVTLLT